MFKSQSWFGLLRIASVTAIGAFLLFLVPAVRAQQDAPGTQTPDVVQMVGPVVLNTDLRKLPYIPNEGETEDEPLTRYPHPKTGAPPALPLIALPEFRSPLERLFPSVPTMPTPVLTFEALSAAQACPCAPPDTDGDVGPNHYVEAVNVAFRVFDKNGNPLSPVTTYNSLFAPLVGTPCQNQNSGDPFVLYDHMADRWVISDFALAGGLPGPGPFYQCIAVSQTSDPVSGGWFLYAIQHEPAHATWVGDYPKFALWNNPQPGGAYHFTVNLFEGPTLNFQGVRTFALDRASMLAGGPANAIAFTVPFAGVGDSYSFVPADFRTGTPPPAGRDELLLAIDAPATGGVTLTQVHARFFHVDFVTPANSTLGVGANHTPNAEITVNGFIDAFTNSAGFTIVPQVGTAQRLQTLGDKIMTPLVYQNRAGTESLWASSTVCTDVNCTGPTGVRWYQFDVTGGNFPATPLQQQTWTNGNDGLYRFMPSIAVDNAGNTAVGYSTSSSTAFPDIRYSGRLATDPLNNLGQGEATMFSGTGSQTGTNGRWGDYTMTTVDPADGLSFWHVNEYYTTTSSFNWHTRIGKFQFGAGGPTPTPSPTPCTPGYTRTTGAGATLVPGTTLLTGSNCDDCSNAVTLPFTFNFYGQPFTTVNAISNGNLQFTTSNTAFTNACLPTATMNNLISPHWDDLLLTTAGSGIYTSVSGAAPNRILNIEWRGGYYNAGTQDGTASFEARLYETTNQIDFTYATLTNTIGTGNGLGATVGLQKDTGSIFDQFECNTASLSSGFRITYVPTVCATPTPTPTPTPSPTPSPTPTPTPTPSPYVVITGAGVAPEVKVFAGPGGAESRDFFAYPNTFTGGVRVAAGDINGDGIQDIIAGIGPGTNPEVRVFSGVDNVIVRDFDAFPPGFAGGVYVAAGDIDGDGRADIITGAGAGGQPNVKVFSGVSGAEIRNFFAFSTGFSGGVRVAAGDINGDGRADIITAVGPGAAPEVKVFSGVDNSVLNDFFVYTPTFTGGVFVAAGDINGDGGPDLITGPDSTSGPEVKVFSGVDLSVLRDFFAYSAGFTGGVRVAAGDIDGDGRADIITAPGAGAGPNVKVFSGVTTSEIRNFFAYDTSFMGGVFVAGGRIPNTAVPTPTPTPPTPTPTPVVSISGHIFYADPGGSVKNALMTLTGNNGFITQTVMTDTSGNYAFNGLPAGNNYTVTPSKTGDTNGLESFDASFAARYVAGLDVPTANQQVAADADGDNVLTSFDASLIARFVAGFSDHGVVGTWRFIPLNRNYPALATNQPNQNYVAILVGDTSGDWFPTGPGAGPETPSWIASDNAARGPQPAAGVTLALPKLTALPGAGITIPVTVGDLTNRGVKAFDLDIAFDPTMLQPQVNAVDTQGTLAAGMLVTQNATEPGHLIISAFRATDIGGAGTLINLKFTVTGASGRTAVLSFADYTDANALVHPAARFNAGSPIALTVKGAVAIGGRSDAGSFSEKLISGFELVSFVLPDRKFAP